MSVSKGGGGSRGMIQYVNYRMRVTLDDSRVVVGRFMAFDQHMNIVLADCEEFRRTKKKDVSEKRALGLVLVRGETVVLLSVESPPPPPPKKRPARPPVGRGTALPALGRGVPVGRGGPPPGLSGPVPGVGIPAAAMQPHLQQQPRMYPTGRGMPVAPGWMGRGQPMVPPGMAPPGIPPPGMPVPNMPPGMPPPGMPPPPTGPPPGYAGRGGPPPPPGPS